MFYYPVFFSIYDFNLHSTKANSFSFLSILDQPYPILPFDIPLALLLAGGMSHLCILYQNCKGWSVKRDYGCWACFQFPFESWCYGTQPAVGNKLFCDYSYRALYLFPANTWQSDWLLTLCTYVVLYFVNILCSTQTQIVLFFQTLYWSTTVANDNLILLYICIINMYDLVLLGLWHINRL